MMIGNRRALLAICTLISTMALIIVVIKGGLKTDIGGVRVEKEKKTQNKGKEGLRWKVLNTKTKENFSPLTLTLPTVQRY